MMLMRILAAAFASKQEKTVDRAKNAFADVQRRLGIAGVLPALVPLIDDPDHSKSEDRFILMGRSLRGRVLVVVHCFRQGGKVIRLISARLAGKQERKTYEEKTK
jgi:uncharacterized DUF497 family protein